MFEIAAFYQFTPIPEPERAQAAIEDLAERCHVQGTVLIATEGINGTVATEGPGVDLFIDELATEFEINLDTVKRSRSARSPFTRFTARLKTEIVASGIPSLNPNENVGTYVAPDDWDDLIRRDDVMVIDCRNSYEIEVGSFEGAIDPETSSFREFADWAERLDPAENPRVAMFCTGGIRCEKATSLLVERGFPEVYHLHGGILRYLAERGDESPTWKGECFVFDRRVSVDPSLNPGTFDICWACRMPVSPEDMSHELYEEGVSCAGCYERWTEKELAAKRERHRQLTQSDST
jgi:UPF0176 protein